MKNSTSDQDIIYGIRTVLEAINSGSSINKLLIQKGLQGSLIKELWRETFLQYPYALPELNRAMAAESAAMARALAHLLIFSGSFCLTN